jgi:hypothetical protein
VFIDTVGRIQDCSHSQQFEAKKLKPEGNPMVFTHTNPSREGFAEIQQATEGGSLGEFSDLSQVFCYESLQFKLNGMLRSIGLRELTMQSY